LWAAAAVFGAAVRSVPGESGVKVSIISISDSATYDAP
jgi:hypothetical protein